MSSRIARTGRILSAERAEAIERAQELVESARKEAATRLETARQQSEAIEEEARARGREAGELEAASCLADAARVRTRMLEGVENEVASLAVDVARRIIGLELTTRPELVADMCLKSLESLRGSRNVAVRANPEDVSILEGANRQLAGSVGPSTGLVIQSDPTLSRGDCVVSSELGSIDARIDSRLESLLFSAIGTGEADG